MLDEMMFDYYAGSSKEEKKEVFDHKQIMLEKAIKEFEKDILTENIFVHIYDLTATNIEELNKENLLEIRKKIDKIIKVYNTSSSIESRIEIISSGRFFIFKNETQLIKVNKEDILEFNVLEHKFMTIRLKGTASLINFVLDTYELNQANIKLKIRLSKGKLNNFLLKEMKVFLQTENLYKNI